MRILVTGAAGYLGRQLLPRLAKHHDVVALTRRPVREEAGGRVTWRQGDLQDHRIVRRVVEGAQAVVHLAGLKGTTPCSQEVREAVEANIVATRDLLEAAFNSGVEKFVFASSYWVYGRQGNEELPCTEQSELCPVEVYGMSKAIAERLIEQSGMNYVIARLSNVFGCVGDEVGDDVVASMVQAAFQRGAIEIYGDGTDTLDLIEADDACRLLQRLTETPTVQRATMNVASGRALSVAALARLVADAFQELYQEAIAIRHVRPPAHTLPFSKAVSIEMLRRLVGPLVVTPVEQALRGYLKDVEHCMAGSAA